MYGQIHWVIREMLQINFGMDKWYEILQASGLKEDRDFEAFSVYKDAETFKLIKTVTAVLEKPMNTILNEFGYYFVTYCLNHGYDIMMLTLGQDMYSFINNLDSLHSMLALSYTGMVSPSFRCEENEDGSLTMHYYSWREGLFPMVTGLVEAVAKDLYNQVARLTLISSERLEVDSHKFQIHFIIRVELQNNTHGSGLVSGKSYSPNKPRIERRNPALDKQLSALAAKTPDFPVEDQALVFPYHMLMNDGLYIQQCGQSVRDIVPDPITTDTCLSDFASITHPIMAPTAGNILHFINSIFYISFRTRDPEQPFVLKGQFMRLPTCGYLLFMGSPYLSWNDLTDANVCLANIPQYDCTRELVLLNQQRLAEIDVAKRLDKTTVELKRVSLALEAEKRRTEELLHEMMPDKVARQFTKYGFAKAEKYDSCTVLFSAIVAFTHITAACEASQVVHMLNDLYNRFDTRTDAYGVYKVETIGDAYMAVTGVPDIQKDHAERMADFAMDLLEEAAHVLSPDTERPLQETVPHGYVFKANTLMEIKGKGKMMTYFLVGTLDRVLDQPDDKFTSLPDVYDPEQEANPLRKKITKRKMSPRPPEPTSIEANSAKNHVIVSSAGGSATPFGASDMPEYSLSPSAVRESQVETKKKHVSPTTSREARGISTVTEIETQESQASLSSNRDRSKYSILKRIEVRPFFKSKRCVAEPQDFQPYTTQQISMLPFGHDNEDSEMSSSFFDKSLRRKGCTIL